MNRLTNFIQTKLGSKQSKMMYSVDSNSEEQTNTKNHMPLSINLERSVEEKSRSSLGRRKSKIKFNLDLVQEDDKTGKSFQLFKHKHKSDTDLVGILKPSSLQIPVQEKRKGKRNSLRKSTGGGSAVSLARMMDAAKKSKQSANTSGSKKNASFNMADHMDKLKKKQGSQSSYESGLIPGWGHESDPNLGKLSLEDFDKKGAQRSRRTSARGKRMPLERRSYPATRFDTGELPRLMPFPARCSSGLYKPVDYFLQLEESSSESSFLIPDGKKLEPLPEPNKRGALSA